jgi:hypothetical protein
MNAITPSGTTAPTDLPASLRARPGPPTQTATRPGTAVATQGGVAPEASMPHIGVGFDDMRSFEFMQRGARALAASTIVPELYRSHVMNKRTKQIEENPSAIPNCMVALNMATRLKSDVLMVMQNLFIIEGRPSWAA